MPGQRAGSELALSPSGRTATIKVNARPLTKGFTTRCDSPGTCWCIAAPASGS